MTFFSRTVRDLLQHRTVICAALLVAAAALVWGALTLPGGLSTLLWVALLVVVVALLGVVALGSARARALVWDLLVVGPRRRAQRAGRPTRLSQVAASRPLRGTKAPDEHQTEVRRLLAAGDVLDAWGAAQERGVAEHLSRGDLLALVRGLRQRGYLRRALTGADVLVERFGRDEDATLRARIVGDVAVLDGEDGVSVDEPTKPMVPVPGRILHVVGASLPDQQSGYTLRTHYTAIAQRQAGLEPHVVTQMGFGDPDGYETVDVDGIEYHRCPGTSRGSGALDAWFAQNVRRVANVVAQVRPAVLHAASDLVNARTALLVGRAYGIPVVYESRGFWEETWLQREADRYGWGDLESLEERYGLPDVYTMRRQTEDRCRREADAVVTLAGVMADRIVAGGVRPEAVTVIPNGVDADRFPVLVRDPGLAASLGITPETVTVGYVSSLVDYEGVDVLVEAVARLRRTSSVPTRLVVVGDGPELETLRELAATLDLSDAVFTGKVSHDEVLRYYSLIDVFVVPRRPVTVCRLVTPLKPFEALSSGRAVVMSDVGALQEIARDSGAAELFAAGSPDSLAEVLAALVADPRRRSEMGAAGAAWVRSARTWAGNAETYVRLYEGLRAVPDGTSALLGVEHALPSADDLRALIAARGPVPFASSVDRDGRSARSVIDDGWVSRPHPPVVFDGSPVDWDTLCATNRSWAFRLHAWDFMGPVLWEYEREGGDDLIDWCRDIAVSWVERFGALDSDAGETMAWYDMALGLRAPRLAYLIEKLLERGEPSEQVETLVAALPRHQRELFADAAFNPRNNHGFYTAAGQMMLARRLSGVAGMPTMEKQASLRMDIVAKTQFAPDGGHLEHSPDYHRMLLGSFSTALDAGLIVNPDVRARISRAAEALGWMIQPDGRMVEIGDSPARDMIQHRTQIAEPSTAFVVSRGRRGAPTQDSMRVLADSGYVFVRHPAPQGQDDHATASYLSFMAGFHSRVHKHADDLSLTWFDRGREILVDAGRYGYSDLLPPTAPERLEGYYYGAPERQYVEATRAHNTLEADGRDQARRGREPYGSAVVGAREKDGFFLVRGRVDHGTWCHERTLVLLPGQWLLAHDSVVGEHAFRSWLNLPADVEPTLVDDSTLAVDLGDDREQLWVEELSSATLIPPVRGQTSPLRGWRSRQDLEFEPAWSTGAEVARTSAHTFRTLLHFGGSPRRAAPEHPFSDLLP